MSDSSPNDNPYLQPLSPQPSIPSAGPMPSSAPPAQQPLPTSSYPAMPISSPLAPAQQPPFSPSYPSTQPPSVPTAQTATPIPPAQQTHTTRPPTMDYSYLNTQPMPGYTQPSPQYGSTPGYTPPNANGYILTQGSDQSALNHRPTNWLKVGMIAAVLCIALGGTGGALYMIKNTTDSVSKATKIRTDAINEILKEVDTAFTLVQKVEAGYQNPFEPSLQKSNPFADVSNPFDEIGF